MGLWGLKSELKIEKMRLSTGEKGWREGEYITGMR